jgi:putative endonuclease
MARMKKGRNQRIGAWGEDAAAAYLEANGYDVVARNVRTPHGEIDILAKLENLWVFVEVKARTSTTLGPPEIAVGPRKQAHMIASAEYYAQQNLIDHWRIDVIAVERGVGGARTTHFQNALS